MSTHDTLLQFNYDVLALIAIKLLHDMFIDKFTQDTFEMFSYLTLDVKRQFIDGESKYTENDVLQSPEKHFVLHSTPQGNMSLGHQGHKKQVHLGSQCFTSNSQP